MKNMIKSVFIITLSALHANNTLAEEISPKSFNDLLGKSSLEGKPQYNKGFCHTHEVLGNDGIKRYVLSHFGPDPKFAKELAPLFNSTSQADFRNLEKFYCECAQKNFKQTMPFRAHRGKFGFLLGLAAALVFPEVHVRYHNFIKERFGIDQTRFCPVTKK
jgi:hypothetical protein